MSSFVVHAATGIPWQKRYLEAIMAGLHKAGHEAKWSAFQEAGEGTHIILGPNAFKQCHGRLLKEGRDHLTINRAFIGSVLGHELNPFVAIGWNGYNNRARFAFSLEDIEIGRAPYSRMKLHDLEQFVGKPRPDRGGVPLVLGEYENTMGYISSAVTELKINAFPFFYRPHPNGPTPPGVRAAPWADIEAAIEASSCCLTHHSTAGALALVRGCPVVSYDRESMTWPVTPHELRSTLPEVPDRTYWLEWLAWTQWTIEEIAQGDPWEFLL